MSRDAEPAVYILAVDDDQAVLETYKTLFTESEGQLDINLLESLLGDSGEASKQSTADFPEYFEIDTTTQGREGAVMAAQRQYAVILLDMRMPGGWDGLETAKAIRAVDQEARIILITAYMDYTMEEIREEIGCHFAYLKKPFDRSELIQLMLLLADDWKRERALIEAEQKALRANRAKDDFLASMSHELRTPLTALLGNCELMADSTLTTSQSELLTSMEVSGRSLLYLINDILDNSKIESGHFDIDEVEFNPLLLIKEMREIFSSKASEAGILFSIEIESDFNRMLIGDGRRLSQVLINLVGNAVKFTHQGSVHLTIRADRDRQQLYLKVTDSGIGMSDEVVSRLFRPFEQADHSISGRFGGTGLGLYISKVLVGLMGGEISATSEEGKGSCFVVTLPLREGAELKSIDIERAKERQPKLALQGRVLIAEDTPELQILERRMVEGFGVEVDIANNGEEAVEKALAKPFDLILMDMQMPVMDGIEATRQLRAAGYSRPIIALTANVMQKHRDDFFEAGCDGFVSKPIDRVELRKALQDRLSVLNKLSTDEGESPLSAAKTAKRDTFIDDELMLLFVERMMVMREELMGAFMKGHWNQVANTAHQIKGSGTSFGYPQLTEVAAKLHDAAKAGQLGEASRLVHELNQEMKQIGS